MENRQENQTPILLLAFDSLLTTSFMIRPRLVVVQRVALLLLHSNTRRDWTMREISESSQKIGKIRLFTKLQGGRVTKTSSACQHCCPESFCKNPESFCKKVNIAPFSSYPYQNCLDNAETVRTTPKLSGQSKNFPDNPETIWTL